MADGYLGEFLVDIEATKYKDFKAADWAMLWIEMYGQIEGAHHKAWTLDQVARILVGTPVIVKEARWTGLPSELRFTLGEPSSEYTAWAEYMLGDPEDSCEYEVGIAP